MSHRRTLPSICGSILTWPLSPCTGGALVSMLNRFFERQHFEESLAIVREAAAVAEVQIAEAKAEEQIAKDEAAASSVKLELAAQ